MDLSELSSKAQNGVFINHYPYSSDDRATREAYRHESLRIENKFRKMFEEAVLNELGLSWSEDITREAAAKNAALNKMLEATFVLCWETGHAEGFSEVVTEAMDMIPLLKAAMEAGRFQ